jgi:hypothetical protein
MQELTIEIEIDEDASITAETKGIIGSTCVEELEKILKSIKGETGFKNKPEFYQQSHESCNRIQLKK